MLTMEPFNNNHLFEVWDTLCDTVGQYSKISGIKPNTDNAPIVSFNQIGLSRKTTLWAKIQELLAPLTEEEVALLLDIAKANDTHTVHQSKVSVSVIVSIPLGLLYLGHTLTQNLNIHSDFIGPIVGGLIGIFSVGGFLVYKQLAYRWLSMEVVTCIETILAQKKAERIAFQKIEATIPKGKHSKITLKNTPIERPFKKQ